MKPSIEPWIQNQPYNDTRQIFQKITHIQPSTAQTDSFILTQVFGRINTSRGEDKIDFQNSGQLTSLP